MIEIKQSEWKGRPIVEIHFNGSKAIGFGKKKAQAIVSAMRDAQARQALEEFSGHAAGDREADQKRTESEGRAKFNEAWREGGKQ